MKLVIVIAEGQTEEGFIKQVVAPAFKGLGIYLKPLLMPTSKCEKGGAFTFERLKRNARNTLLQNPNAILSTFIDLYALDTDFPGFEESKKQADVYQRVAFLEKALHETIINHVACRKERFIPHIQPYEFEGLLFSDLKVLCELFQENWSRALPELLKIREKAESPEHINDGYETKPSRRLELLLTPKYRKTAHGPIAAKMMGLHVIERECQHFKGWLDSLRSLSELNCFSDTREKF